LEIPVWIVFNDEDVVLDTKSIDFFAALNGEDSAGWVLADSVY
jgi:hypothetical protein